MTYEEYRRKKEYYWKKYHIVLEPEEFFGYHKPLESNDHKIIKNCAKILLEQLGFHVELECNVNNYRLDVYANRGSDVIVVECGYCAIEKLNELRKQFKKVIHIPYTF